MDNMYRVQAPRRLWEKYRVIFQGTGAVVGAYRTASDAMDARDLKEAMFSVNSRVNAAQNDAQWGGQR